MNQFLVIIAIIGIGYLLYRSFVIKRQPTDEDEQVRDQQVRKTSVDNNSSAAVSTSTQQPTATDSQSRTTPNPAESAPRGQVDTPTPVPDQQPATAPAVENPVGKEAAEEARQAKAKAAEKSHMATAEKATKSQLEQSVGSGVVSDSAPPVPPSVETHAAALRETDDPLARHRLYQQIVEQCYRGRDDQPTRLALLHYANAHISEFAEISKPLKKQNGGKLPQVATFKHYAAVLTDSGQYDEAIAVCQQALSYDLKDGTKTGYQGRLERIEKLKAKHQG